MIVPSCDARTVIVPAARTVKVPASMDAGPLTTVSDTGNSEVAVGVSCTGASPYTLPVNEPNVMVCALGAMSAFKPIGWVRA